ncbi:alpha-2-macroglobulin-like protein 1 [Microcaecilia unicolor]|uniref:Alpha-2-macroglobulin-like protein 1 n=1 Tax=Microcaecilia unicolor TaxID=1415580 RepID=A0A6P7X0Y4_9AMPH|nr:alpha-2-macroglobulin-like protein 1 [Microcaecilia unicolor]
MGVEGKQVEYCPWGRRYIVMPPPVLYPLSALTSSFTISMTFTSDLAPVASLLVYTIVPQGGVTADRAEFQVSMCFKNQVTIEFSVKEDLPGSRTGLQLSAAPGSLWIRACCF